MSQTTHTPVVREPFREAPQTSPSARPASAAPKRWRRAFWGWLVASLVLSGLTALLGVHLFFFSERSVPPPPGRKIAVPFADNPAVLAPFSQWVVQEDGRNKPFDTFCRETVRTVTGREKFEGNNPIAVVLSWLLLYEKDREKAQDIARKTGCDWEEYPFILCDFHELREILYRDRRGSGAELTEEELHGKYVEPSTVRNSLNFKKIIRESAAKTEKDSRATLTKLELKAREVKKRLALYDRIRTGGQEGRERVHAPGEFGVVALDRHGKTWFSLRSVREYRQNAQLWDEMLRARRIANHHDYEGKGFQPIPSQAIAQVDQSFQSLQTAYRSGDAETFSSAAGNFFAIIGRTSETFSAYPGTQTTGLELWYNSANPFRKAWIVSLLAALLFVTTLATQQRWPGLGRTCYIAGMLTWVVALGWSCAGFYCRITISGRPPVSNMYESVIWVAFMTAFLGLGLELFYRRSVVALAGCLVSTLGLVLADQLPLTLAPNIQPLQAVLRSNYWLVIHVLTIVSSYAAFALAWGLGNFNLALMIFAPERGELTRTLTSYCYRAIQIGVVLLAAGTLLGGFWAAESWGRFWGWDPKEVWALIALLCYIIPLHARYVGWVKDFGLAVCSVACFASVVMAWYGVNFVLGAGLHSYGFGGGNDVWVYWGGLINLTLVAWAACRHQQVRETVSWQA